MKWINVKDELPQPSYGTRILAYGISPRCSCASHPQIEFCRYSDEKIFEFGEYDCPFEATHWMPLPGAPSASQSPPQERKE